MTSAPTGSSSADTTTTPTSSTTATTETSETTDTIDPPAGCVAPAAPVCTRMLNQRGTFEAEEVRSPKFSMTPLQQPSSVVTGDFNDDGRPDLAVSDFGSQRMHLFLNESIAGWTEPVDAATMLAGSAPFDIVYSDLECDGGHDFLAVGQTAELARRSFNGGFPPVQSLVASSGNFSLAVGELVDDLDDYPDVVLSGNAGVLLVENVAGTLTVQLMTPATIEEPWDTTILPAADGPLVLVPEGRNFAGGDANHAVRVFVVDDGGDMPELVAPPDLQLGSDFASPWSVIYGDFVGDEAIDVAIGERHVDSVYDGMNDGEGENTSTDGTVRLFTYRGRDADPVWEPAGTIITDPGLNSMSAADLDCDGYDDIVVGLNGSSSAPGVDSFPQVIFGDSDPAAMASVTVTATGTMAAGSRQAVADFDDDGSLEVAIADFGFGELGSRVVIIGLQ